MQYKSPLLQSLQSNLRLQHLSRRTEAAYVYWTKRFVRFSGLRHPAELGVEDVRRFLTHLVMERHLSAATQQQALAALLFLYRHVLDRPLEALGRLPRGRVPTTLPVVFTPDEVALVLGLLSGISHLVAVLLYGSGLRLTECLTLRVKDLDLSRGELTIRRGKGGKDRVTVIPDIARLPLQAQLERVRAVHTRDLEAGAGWVELPEALHTKYPRAGSSWPWQWIFRLGAGSWMGRPGGFGVITCTSRRFSGPWRRRCDGAGLASGRAATRCVTRSPPTCWRRATTSGRCRSCWVTGTSRPR